MPHNYNLEISPVNQYLRSLLAPREASALLRFAEENLIPIITPEIENFLKLLLSLKKPNSILEIGTAIGYSAIFMHNITGAPVTTIEKNPETAQIAAGNFKDFPKIHLLIGDALETLPTLDDSFDFIFLDAAKNQYLSMFPHLMRLLAPKGVLVCDNVLFKGKIIDTETNIPHKHRTATRNLREFLMQISNHPELQTAVIPLGDGLSVSEKI